MSQEASTVPAADATDPSKPYSTTTQRAKREFKRFVQALKPSNKDVANFLSSYPGPEASPLNINHPSSGVEIDPEEQVIYVKLPTTGEVAEGEDEGEPVGEPVNNVSIYYQKCIDAQKTYEQTLEKCLESPQVQPVASTQKDIGRRQAFDRVEANIANACTHLENVQKGREDRNKKKTLAGRLHAAFAGFRNHAQDAKSFVSLLPAASTFGSTICGGISIVLKAAERYAAWEQTFVNALEKIKDALTKKAYIGEQYPPDAKMHELISELFARIFVVLELMVQWVFQKPAVRGLYALLSPDTYGKSLTDAVAAMETRAVSLADYSRGHEFGILKELLSKSVKASLCSQQKMEEMQKTLENLSTQMGKRTVVDQATCVITMNVLLASDPPRVVRAKPSKQVSATRQRQQQPSTPMHTSPQDAHLIADAILQGFQQQTILVTKDCRSVFQGCRLDNEGDLTVSVLSKHVRLQAFLRTDSHYAMLIEGGPRGRSASRGPITFVTAKIVDALDRNRNHKAASGVYVIGYFCSEHRNTRKPFGTVLDMVLTLMLQLVNQYRYFDSELLQLFGDMLRSKAKAMDDLCHLFERLIQSLPEDSLLFCVVDGIELWEDPRSREQQMFLIVQLLLRFGRGESQGHMGPKVKCLFTTPARSIKFKALFEPHEVFTHYNNFGPSGQSSPKPLGRIGSFLSSPRWS